MRHRPSKTKAIDKASSCSARVVFSADVKTVSGRAECDDGTHGNMFVKKLHGQSSAHAGHPVQSRPPDTAGCHGGHGCSYARKVPPVYGLVLALMRKAPNPFEICCHQTGYTVPAERPWSELEACEVAFTKVAMA